MIEAAPSPSPAVSRPEHVSLRISTAVLGAALLAFLLPVASVSCATPPGYGSVGAGVTASYSGLTLGPDLAKADPTRFVAPALGFWVVLALLGVTALLNGVVSVVAVVRLRPAAARR